MYLLTYLPIIIIRLSVFLFCFQDSTEANYVATVKTARQVKTVFIIFIAFVCCWIPYIVVLLYDSSDTLPLTVHLYTSMLAHLHASLNFAIYNLSNRTVRIGYRRLVERCVACCCRRTKASNASAVGYSSGDTLRSNVKRSGCIRVVNTLSVTVECYELQDVDD